MVTNFQFNNQFYKQTDRVSMSSPIAPCMVDICLTWVLDKVFKSDVHQPTILIRYVDDLFSVFNNEVQLNGFFNVLNSIHPNVY